MSSSPTVIRRTATRRFATGLMLAALCISSPRLAATQNTGGAADAVSLPASWVSGLKWRGIGPASMGGRITAISVCESDPNRYWVATASGGLLKTTNNGVTFEHQFDKEATVSVGAVCVAPSNPEIVWVGTGENNPRNSVSFGDGVYKSLDGGKTWQNVGLRDTYQIGDVIVHPKDPNTVYVGALGRLWGRNKERGLYKTTDGGATWNQILYLDDKTGVIDLAMSPSDPETLLVAMWERKRDAFDAVRGTPPPEEGHDAYDPAVKWGDKAGIYRTTDGGKSFKKVSSGLPSSNFGRVGLDWYQKNPNVVFAIVDCRKIGMGKAPSNAYAGIQGVDAPNGARLTVVTDGAPAAAAGLLAGDVVTRFGSYTIESYERLTNAIRAYEPNETVPVTVRRANAALEVQLTLAKRPDSADPNRASAAVILRALVEDVAEGVRVRTVLTGGVAEASGLQPGDVIVEAGGKPAATQQALLPQLQTLRPGSRLRLTVLRGTERKNIELRTPRGDVSGPGGSSVQRPWGFMYAGQQPNIQEFQGEDGQEYGGVYRSDDAGATWKRINSLNPRPMYFSQVRVDPMDERYLYVLGVSLYRSRDGGKTFKPDGSDQVHADQHALWINPRDGRHMVLGCDGGFYATYDRMDTWDHLNHKAIAQFYHVAVDSRTPYRALGGLQDNGSWSGPSQGLAGSGPINEDWYNIGQGDGFVCRVDPKDPDLVYSESQDGNIVRRHLKTGERAQLRPRAGRGQSYRFNWNTPFILSSHNSAIFYSAGNFVFKSVKRGDDLKVISPEISRTGRGTATALSESPRNPDVLWVGTDDGNLWVTQDGGSKWSNVTRNVGLKIHPCVSTIEASRFADGRAYVAFDGHRSDDDLPLLYATEDFGETWKPISANLPVGSTRCLREDLENENLLLTGTEFAVWASIDRGKSWTRINNNLPTVAVHELAIHPTAGEVVAATHGRSLWVLNLLPLRQMSRATLSSAAFLYSPGPAVRWRTEPAREANGHRRFVGENAPTGAQITFSLARGAQSAAVRILDASGAVVRELPAPTQPGLHTLTWNLSRVGGGGRGGFGGAGAGPGGAPATTGGGGRGGRGQRPGTGAPGPTAPMGAPTPMGGAPGGESAAPPAPPAGGRFGGFGAAVPPGDYRVVLVVDGKEQSRPLKVERDPTLIEASPRDDLADEEELQMLLGKGK